MLPAQELQQEVVLLAGELVVDDALEDVEWLRAVDRATVDEECRRSVHADGFGGRDVSVDAGLLQMPIDTGIELRRVQTDRHGVILQVGIGQSGGVGEQAIVILPEAALRAGALRGLGRPLRLVAEEGEMLPHDLHVTGRYVLLLDLTP